VSKKLEKGNTGKSKQGGPDGRTLAEFWCFIIEVVLTLLFLFVASCSLFGCGRSPDARSQE
jgi:hypothetical protein